MVSTFNQEEKESFYKLIFIQGASEEVDEDGADLEDDDSEDEIVPTVTKTNPAAKSKIENPDKVYELFKQTQAELKEAKKALKSYAGFAPEEIKTLKEAKAAADRQAEELRQKDLESKGQYEALYRERFEKEKGEVEKHLSQKEKQIAALQKQLESTVQTLDQERLQMRTTTLRDKVKSAFFANGGLTGDPEEGADAYFDNVWSRFGGRFNLTDSGIEILAADGSNLEVDSEGKAIDLNGFMGGLKGRASTKYLFEGISPQGNSTPPSIPTRGKVESGKGTVRTITQADARSRLTELGISLEDIMTGKVKVVEG